MIIGTAGHIDHGKSTLVTALTGRSMDRLAEEQRRGITIELGFAPLDLEGVPPIGIVDVPGHEDFIRTMVAGASGIDVVLLVVDAVEGIRPQTLEHLAIAELLGIPAGLPVITKADLADPDWVELVRADLWERLARSPIAFEEPLVVSATTGQGLDALKNAIRKLAATRPGPGTADLFRMPVDRVFALAGVGTVVTGTVWSGRIQLGATVRLEPGGLRARVRSVESFGRQVEAALPGARAAIGLAGVERVAVVRGMVVVEEESAWAPSEVLDCVVSLLADAPRPLVTRSRVRFHHGTTEVMARAYPRAPIAPGRSGLARLVLEAPALVRGGDRFVLRSFSPVATIGGGWIADPLPPRRCRWPEELGATDALPRLVALLERRPVGAGPDQLAVLLGLPPGEADSLARSTPLLEEVVGRWVTKALTDQAAEMLLQRLRKFHREEPSSPGFSLETLRQALGAGAWMADAIVARLGREGKVRAAEAVVALQGFVPASAGGEAEVERVVNALQQAGLEPPSVPELSARLGLRDLTGALRIAAGRRLVEAVERDRYFSAEGLDRFTEALRAVGQGGIEVTPAALRDRLGLSRKFLIPLLEWADRKGITRRDTGGRRTLT